MRNHNDRYKLKSPALHTPKISIQAKRVNLTANVIKPVEQHIAWGFNIVRHKYTIKPNFKGN